MKRLPMNNLPARRGPRPQTTPTNPHAQLDQNAPEELQRETADFMFGLSGVREVTSRVSVPGSRAMWLEESCEAGPPHAFMVGREFCHLHPPHDGSLHMNVPRAVLEVAVEKGWAEQHPLAARGVIPENVVMVYGPRDREELEVVKALIAEAHAFASPITKELQEK
ncbi:MAG: luciferase family protein [Acidobacteriota bacterium]